MGQMDVMIQSYKNMLQFVSNPNITRNECTDAINSVLDSISSSVGGAVLSEVRNSNRLQNVFIHVALNFRCMR